MTFNLCVSIAAGAVRMASIASICIFYVVERYLAWTSSICKVSIFLALITRKPSWALFAGVGYALPTVGVVNALLARIFTCCAPFLGGVLIPCTC